MADDIKQETSKSVRRRLAAQESAAGDSAEKEPVKGGEESPPTTADIPTGPVSIVAMDTGAEKAPEQAENQAEPMAGADMEPKPDAKPVEAPAPALDEEMLFVDVPKAFKLTTNDHVVHQISAGAQMMKKSMAEHWYAKANKVTVVEK